MVCKASCRANGKGGQAGLWMPQLNGVGWFIRKGQMPQRAGCERLCLPAAIFVPCQIKMLARYDSVMTAVVKQQAVHSQQLSAPLLRVVFYCTY